MTDFANLAIRVDTSEVREGIAELDRLVPAGQRAEQAAGRLTQAQDRVTASAGAQRAGMQALSYQIGDVAQQFALGTNPMIIFAQQGGQVVQALGMMQGGAKGLIGFLAGPWGAVIMGAATVAGMFASKLWESKDAANDAADGYKNAAAEARNLIGAMNAVALNQKRMDLNKVTQDIFRLESQMRDPSLSPGSEFRSANDLASRIRRGGQEKELQALKWQQVELKNLVSIAERENAAIEAKAKATEKAGGATRSASGATGAYAKAMREATREAELLTKSLNDLADGVENGLYVTMRETQKTAASDLNDELRGVQEELIKNQKARTQGAIDEAEAQARLNDQLRDLVRNLDQLGGMGRTLGDIGAFYNGAKTGDFSGVRGPIGYLAQSLFTTDAKDENGKAIKVLNGLGQDFSKALDKVFGEQGSFLKILQNAGMGAAFGGLFFNQQNKGAQAGSTIGGAFGEAAFKSLAPKLFSSLGSFAGPLGTLAGSLIGGLFGGLFGKAKTGSASVSGGKVVGGGNDGQAQGTATGIAGQIGSTLGNIADALGGTLGDYGFTIGMRKDEYRVSGSSGANVTSKKPRGLIYKGKDAAEAARIALLNAIQDGAIQGISQGAQRLIAAGKDLDTQVRKALKFQGVFEELKASTDPFGAALDKLNKQFNELRAIFAEAGASAEEYAKLEQLLAIKRTEAQDEARRAVVDKVRDPLDMQIRILELLGKEEDALAASRLLEMAGLKATLQPLQTMIYQLEDAQKVIATFEPLAEDLKAFRKELLGGQGEQSFGHIAAQFRTIAQAAANGDATALGQLRGVSSNYLDAARMNAGSDLEYRRALGTVLASVDQGIFAAETQVDYAQAQIDAIKQNAATLAEIKSTLDAATAQIVNNSTAATSILKRWDAGDNGAPLQVEVVV